MNETKKVRIFLKPVLQPGFRYEGNIIKESDTFLTIFDTFKNKEISIAQDQISIKEEI